MSARRWDPRKWGTLDDPIHKSQVSSLIGEWSCTKQFQFDRIREASGDDARGVCSGKTEMGTAAHETIARALRSEATCAAVLAGASTVTLEQVTRIVLEEFGVACGRREVVWYGKHEQDDVLEDVSAMVFGLLHDLHRHVAAVELVEAGFIAPVGDYWIEGHTDLIYRPREAPDKLAFTDWKTGADRPHQIVLDHGYESGIYSAALKFGLFLPVDTLRAWREGCSPLDEADAEAVTRAPSERFAMHQALRALARKKLAGVPLPVGVRQFGQFPDIIRLTHLPAYVPYQKKGTKTVERAEDAEQWSRVLGRAVSVGEKVPYERGQHRGAAWLRVNRTEHDIARFTRLLRGIVGWVRMGKFVEAVGEKCTRCPYRHECLTSGYELRGDEARDLTRALRQLDLGDVDIGTMD